MGERKHEPCKRLYDAKKFETIKEMFNHSKETYGNEMAFKLKVGEGKYRDVTYNEYIDNVNALGTALISIGLQGKKIGIIGENRYEWEEAYLAVTGGTGIVVPLDKALPEIEVQNLVERSGMEAIFYTEKFEDMMKKFRTEKIGNLNCFISMDTTQTDGKIYSQKELIEIGKGLIKNGARSFLDAKINPDEMAIMLFTSGTTSKSKAVALSNTNVCTNIYDISTVFDINKNDTALSFLPLHHVFEATVGFLYFVSVGACITFCEGIRHIADNLKEYEISVMISVPLLIENMHKKLMKSIEKKGKLKKVKFGLKLSNLLRKIGIDKRRKIFNEIHENLGGKLRLFVSGAAALDPTIEKGFNDLGVETYQGYGLTETSPVIAAEHKTVTRMGSIGKLFPSMEGKIVEPDEQGIGELAVKGPIVMLEYVGNEEATKEVIKDGWFLTGDLAYFDKDDYIFITGRKKSVIVLKNGKNIFPEEIETLIARIPGVKESFVFGKPDVNDDTSLKICAKIVYDKELVKEEYNLTEHEDIKNKLWEKIKEVNKKMPKYKYIKDIIVTDEELIKTTTQKVKRFEEIKRIK